MSIRTVAAEQAAAFIGAGLLFAGVTGTCALAAALRRMPWNHRMVSPS